MRPCSVLRDRLTRHLGENVTLDVILRRTGNGSEVPSFLDTTLRTIKNNTLALHTRPLGAGADFFGPLGDEDWHLFYEDPEMLMARSHAELEQERQERHGRSRCGISSRSMRLPPLGRHTVRYHFHDESGRGAREEYRFELHLKM